MLNCSFSLQARSSRDTGKSPSSLGLADFDLLRVIGRGSYAKVLLVQLKKTERIYAMKVVKKELVNDDEVNPDFKQHFTHKRTKCSLCKCHVA